MVCADMGGGIENDEDFKFIAEIILVYELDDWELYDVLYVVP